VRAEKFVEGQIVPQRVYVLRFLLVASSIIKIRLRYAVAERNRHSCALETYKNRSKKISILAQVISSGIEICDNYMRISWRRADHENRNEFPVPDIPWTEVDWKALHEPHRRTAPKANVSGWQEFFTAELVTHRSILPDYLARCIPSSLGKTYLAMERGDIECFSASSQPLSQHHCGKLRLQTILKEKDARLTLAWSKAIHDIVELSVYAKLFPSWTVTTFMPSF